MPAINANTYMDGCWFGFRIAVLKLKLEGLYTDVKACYNGKFAKKCSSRLERLSGNIWFKTVAIALELCAASGSNPADDKHEEVVHIKGPKPIPLPAPTIPQRS